jgi:hypothetical protein
VLHPEDNGVTIALPDEAVVWDEELRRAKARIKELEEEIKEIEEGKRHFENLIKLAIGDNTYGLLPDNRRYGYLTRERDGYSVKSSKYRELRQVSDGADCEQRLRPDHHRPFAPRPASRTPETEERYIREEMDELEAALVEAMIEDEKMNGGQPSRRNKNGISIITTTR